MNVWSWFQMIILIMHRVTAFWKKGSKNTGSQCWQILPFSEKRQKPSDFDKVLWPSHFRNEKKLHTPAGKTMSISFIWHLVFQKLTTHTPVMTSQKKWTQLVLSINQEISPVLSYSTAQVLWSWSSLRKRFSVANFWPRCDCYFWLDKLTRKHTQVCPNVLGICQPAS